MAKVKIYLPADEAMKFQHGGVEYVLEPSVIQELDEELGLHAVESLKMWGARVVPEDPEKALKAVKEAEETWNTKNRSWCLEQAKEFTKKKKDLEDICEVKPTDDQQYALDWLKANGA